MRVDFHLILDAAGRPPADLGEPGARAWRLRLGRGGASVWGAAPAARRGGLGLWLKGSLYGTTPSGVLDLYARHGLDFARHLEGSFALVLTDETRGRALVVTDRLASHALYAHDDHDGGTFVSTRPDWAPFRARPLDPAGVGCYLANGCLFGGLTVHDGVRALRRATVHEWRPDARSAHPYWPLHLGGAPDTRPLPELRAELGELLRAAVARRLPGGAGGTYLSLSGGYDSRGLLALLSASGQAFETFSYTLGARRPRPGSDAAVAARLAARVGVRHHLLDAYAGDLVAVLRRNAEWGGSTANFCDEADAWAHLAELAPRDVFVGDQPFELSAAPGTPLAEQLKSQRLNDFSPLAWLSARLPAVHADLQEAWEDTLAGIAARAAAHHDPDHQEIALMLDEFFPGHLLPWRERYAGRVANVHNPYLDTALLEFVQRIPARLLADKALFKAALRDLNPELLAVPLARTPGYEADWRAEFALARPGVAALLAGEASPLDALIPPEVLLDLLAGVQPAGRPERLKAQARRTLGTLRRTGLGLRLLGLPPARTAALDVPSFLRRALTMREAVRPDSAPALSAPLPLWPAWGAVAAGTD